MPKCSREVVAQFLCEHGLPQMLTFDHDPREVAEPYRTGFPLRAGALPALSWRATECSSPRIDPISAAYVERDHSFAWSGVLAGPSASHARAGC
jgi:hypothetical protein